MVSRNRFHISLTAGLLLVLAQVLVLNHVHEHSDVSSICAYCVSADSTDAGVAAAPGHSPRFSCTDALPPAVPAPDTLAHRHYASRAPPVISS